MSAITNPAKWTAPTGCPKLTAVFTLGDTTGLWQDVFANNTKTLDCYPPTFNTENILAASASQCPNGWSLATVTSTTNVCCSTGWKLYTTSISSSGNCYICLSYIPTPAPVSEIDVFGSLTTPPGPIDGQNATAWAFMAAKPSGTEPAIGNSHSSSPKPAGLGGGAVAGASHTLTVQSHYETIHSSYLLRRIF